MSTPLSTGIKCLGIMIATADDGKETPPCECECVYIYVRPYACVRVY